eukprot:14034164-Alexandrium_andersonii.AAC.1
MGGHGQSLRAFLGHVKRRRRELSVIVCAFQKLCVGVVRAEHVLCKEATAAGGAQSEHVAQLGGFRAQKRKRRVQLLLYADSSNAEPLWADADARHLSLIHI